MLMFIAAPREEWTLAWAAAFLERKRLNIWWDWLQPTTPLDPAAKSAVNWKRFPSMSMTTCWSILLKFSPSVTYIISNQATPGWCSANCSEPIQGKNEVSAWHLFPSLSLQNLHSRSQKNNRWYLSSYLISIILLPPSGQAHQDLPSPPRILVKSSRNLENFSCRLFNVLYFGFGVVRLYPFTFSKLQKQRNIKQEVRVQVRRPACLSDIGACAATPMPHAAWQGR